MGLFLVFNLIFPIWKNICLQLMGRATGMLVFIDMKPSNDLLFFLMEKTVKFLAIIMGSVVLRSLSKQRAACSRVRFTDLFL